MLDPTAVGSDDLAPPIPELARRPLGTIAYFSWCPWHLMLSADGCGVWFVLAAMVIFPCSWAVQILACMYVHMYMHV